MFYTFHTPFLWLACYTLYLSIHPLPTAQLMIPIYTSVSCTPLMNIYSYHTLNLTPNLALQVNTLTVYARFTLIFSCSLLCTPKGILNLMETGQHDKTCIPIEVGLWHAVVQLLVLEWPAVKKAIGHIIVTFLALRQAALGADCPSSC